VIRLGFRLYAGTNSGGWHDIWFGSPTSNDPSDYRVDYRHYRCECHHGRKWGDEQH
jgi:hypothetical protein